jgi:hypothetical protein
MFRTRSGGHKQYLGDFLCVVYFNNTLECAFLSLVAHMIVTEVWFLFA